MIGTSHMSCSHNCKHSHARYMGKEWHYRYKHVQVSVIHCQESQDRVFGSYHHVLIASTVSVPFIKQGYGKGA